MISPARAGFPHVFRYRVNDERYIKKPGACGAMRGETGKPWIIYLGSNPGVRKVDRSACYEENSGSKIEGRGRG